MEEQKEINAVALVRQIRDQHAEALAEKSAQARIAFYREKSRALRSELRKNQAREDS